MRAPGARSVAFGDPAARRLARAALHQANADVREGDLLTTSGVDGVYPPGLPVAQVEKVEWRADSAFRPHLLQGPWPGCRVRRNGGLKPVTDPRSRPQRPPGRNTVTAGAPRRACNDHCVAAPSLHSPHDLPPPTHQPAFIASSLAGALFMNIAAAGP